MKIFDKKEQKKRDVREKTSMDYTVYHFSKQEIVKYGILGLLGSALVLYLFYHSLFVCILLGAPGAVLFLRYMNRALVKKRQWQLMTEFKDAMDSFVAALVAGYSMDNAITEGRRDLMLMYRQETPMIRELGEIRQKLRLGQALDQLLLDLGRRSGVEDIVTFAQIYSTARRSGGNLVKVMKRTTGQIGEKIEVQREIQTVIAGKKMEASCMMVIPLMIILYLQIFSPGFLDPLYRGLLGRMFMSAALILYGAAVAWSRKIMDIQGV